MPNAYLPGLLQIRPQYTASPTDLDIPENILWFRSANVTTPTLANIQAIQAIFDGDWALIFAEYGAEGRYYSGSVVTDWSNDTGLAWSSVGTFTPQEGTAAGVLPSQVAALVSWTIAQRWRGGHPRTYLPWVGNGAIQSADPNLLNTSIVSGMVTNITNLQNDMAGSGVLGGQSQVVFRFRDDPAKAALWEIAEFTVQSELATQRRRIRKVSRR